MRRYLLDTNIITAYLRGRSGAVSLVQPWMDADEAATSIVVYGEAIELFKGLSDVPRRQRILRALFRQVQVYDLSYAILERYADLRRAMRPPHGPGLIGDVDTLIAATALEHGLTIVTLDGDFARAWAGSNAADARRFAGMSQENTSTDRQVSSRCPYISETSPKRRNA